MGIFGNGYILEGKGKTEDNISSFVSLFYAHLAKWVFIPIKQSSSWIDSLKKARTGFKKIRKREKGYLDHYIIDYDNMDSKIISRLDDDNTVEVIRSMNFQQLYRDFPTIDYMLNTDYLRKYLYKYQHDKSINIDFYINDN